MVHHGDCNATTLQEHRDEPCHLNQSFLLYIGREVYVYFDGGGGRRCVSFSLLVADKFTKNSIFFGEKYLYLLLRFIENALTHVYTFFVFYQSLLEIIAWFIVFFRCNHQPNSHGQNFETQKVAYSYK
jgi:hypothetical protein